MGSEMCIRDRSQAERAEKAQKAAEALLGSISRNSQNSSRHHSPRHSPRGRSQQGSHKGSNRTSPKRSQSPGGRIKTPGGGRLSPGGRRYPKSPGRTPTGSGRGTPTSTLSPAVEKQAQELGLCFSYLRNKCHCKTGAPDGECKYKHEYPPGFKPLSKPNSLPASGTASPRKKGDTSKIPCRNGDDCDHHKKGRCKFWHAPGTAKVCLLGAALMHAAASMCITPTTADLNGLHGRSYAAYVVPNVTQAPLKSCFMPAHKTGRRIRHPDVEFPSVRFGSASWVNTIVDSMIKGSTRLIRCAKRRKGPNRSTGLNSNCEASAGVNRAVRTALDLGYDSNITYGVPALGGPKWWVADTGSGNDLISRKFLSGKDEKKIKPSTPITLNTANDTVVSSEVVPMRMSLTKEKIEPLVLNSVPPVMSVGRRCLQDGWEFHWYADCEPYFVCLLYTSPSPRDLSTSRMPSSA